jgi:hypothetical protein
MNTINESFFMRYFHNKLKFFLIFFSHILVVLVSLIVSIVGESRVGITSIVTQNC